MSFDENFYVIEARSYIKNVPTFLSLDFLKDLKNEDGTLKNHVSNLDTNVTYYGAKSIKASIPTCFVEVIYKTPNNDRYMINYDCFLYEENFPTLKSLKAFQKATDYAFASQVTQEIKDIVEAFHNGYGCECLSSGDY
tara:strand:- start:283 stop:696 length:414 start_codon:yes stop_codon:yes gene_type:complete